MVDHTRPTTAMVLAAGRGERMRPLTDTRPKPLVALDGRPLIDHVLDRLAKAGIGRVVVNVHYLADLLQTHLANRQRPQIVLSDERDALLDTGGGLVRALPLLGSAPFLIHNSDTVWIEDDVSNLDRLIGGWDGARMDTLLLLAPMDRTMGYDGPGDFSLSAEGKVVRRAKGEKAPYVFAGVSIAHPRLFSDAPASAFSLNLLWDKAIAAGRAFGLPLDGLWMHVGTPAAVTEAEALIAAHCAGQCDRDRTSSASRRCEAISPRSRRLHLDAADAEGNASAAKSISNQHRSRRRADAAHPSHLRR
jgi:MurNAc alpha-1-phosphate uridylyltransferase